MVLYTGSFRDMGFCSGYGLSHVVHLATLTEHTFQCMIIQKKALAISAL